jgi:hypothetical protein
MLNNWRVGTQPYQQGDPWRERALPLQVEKRRSEAEPVVTTPRDTPPSIGASLYPAAHCGVLFASRTIADDRRNFRRPSGFDPEQPIPFNGRLRFVEAQGGGVPPPL